MSVEIRFIKPATVFSSCFFPLALFFKIASSRSDRDKLVLTPSLSLTEAVKRVSFRLAGGEDAIIAAAQAQDPRVAK